MNEKIPEIILEFRDISGICFLAYFFEIFCTVFTERTDEVLRKLVALVDISADLADPSGLFFFDLWLWLWFDVCEVVCVSYRWIR